MVSPAGVREEIRAIRTFRSLATLRVLNVIAVASSLAGATGSVFAIITHRNSHDRLATISAITTFLFGLGWAALLRDRKRSASGYRRGWLATVPLAAGNAGTACAILAASTGNDFFLELVKGFLLGATVGAFIWIPALLTTLAVFGLPIAWAQKRADRGLAGEERGELVIGLVSAALAILALFAWASSVALDDASPGFIGVGALSAVGLVTGAIASAFALRRASVRRKFVQEVEEGAVEGYRVDETPEGKVLLRVQSLGTGYRVGNFEELLYHVEESEEARLRRSR